jgi:hypothetical protein
MFGQIPGWARVTSALLFAIGLLFAIAELESPDLVLWTGKAVAGTEVGSVVSYSYQGVHYSFDTHDRFAYDPPISVVVYLDPRTPGDAVLNKPAARWAEAGLVLAPIGAAFAVAVVGTWSSQRRHRASERLRERGVYGYGFPSGSIERIARRGRGQREDTDADTPPGEQQGEHPTPR